MLRHLTVKNFVYFKDEYCLDFRKGSNFFIGPNNSGKSSIFEAIRRCSSTSKNTSLSSPFDPSELSVIVAFFDVPKDNATSRNETLVSSVIRLPETEEDDELQVYVKIVYSESNKTVELDFVKEVNTGGIANQRVKLSDSKRQYIYSSVCKFNEADFNTDRFSNVVLEQVRDLREQFASSEIDETYQNTECEILLKEKVDPHIIVMFPVRGIGTLQWSRSERISSEYKKINTDEVQRRAEILNWYFDNVEQNSEEDNLQSKYFNLITNNSEMEFVRENHKVTVRNLRASKRRHAADSTDALSLVKVSDGIIEAKNCAILLAMKNVRTLCIEEPEKGMNPQMIERLRDLILQRLKDKTIILTSHHPSLLAPWTVPRIWFFRRIHREDELSFKIISGTIIENLDCGNDEKKTPRIVTSDHFASMFFARRVLLLEGEADFLFLTTLVAILLEDPEKTERLLHPGAHGCTQKSHLKQFRTFLCSLHIVKMNGEPNKLRLHKMCEALHIEGLIILDYDAILAEKKIDPETKLDQPTSTIRTKQIKTADRFLEEFSLSNKYTAQVIENDVALLETEGIFVWNKTDDDARTGTVEEVFMALCENDDKRKQFLKNQNVNLNYNRDSKTKSKQKLFGSKKVTSSNITEVVNTMIDYVEDDFQNCGKQSQVLRLLRFLYVRATEHAKF